jgi:hypothetical protein
VAVTVVESVVMLLPLSVLEIADGAAEAASVPLTVLLEPATPAAGGSVVETPPAGIFVRTQ